ncbi:Pentatricopeptide repeat [Sesbania bispinosa]|nr:Pentatricopeptide repeat [Sesbania bispinosa]
MSRQILSSLLRSCATHSAASQCHAQSVLQALLPNVTLETDLLLAYSRLGLMGHARKLFDKMPERNMHSWNIMIASYAQSSMYSDALTVFHAFKRCGLRPDHYTLPPLFKTSIGTGEACVGSTCHSLVIKLGYEGYAVVTNSVLEFYLKCGNMSQALCVVSKDTAHWYEKKLGFRDVEFVDLGVWKSCQYGELVHVKIPAGKGCGFVQFADRSRSY